VGDDHIQEQNACCGSCQNRSHERPRLVVGVFADIGGANHVASRLRVGTAGNVNVVSGSVPVLADDPSGVSHLSLRRCGRLYEQINRHLASGAAIVVVDAISPEEQVGVSRILLEHKCDMLLTHDGSRQDHAHAD
jgi:hypothetical protein